MITVYSYHSSCQIRFYLASLLFSMECHVESSLSSSLSSSPPRIFFVFGLYVYSFLSPLASSSDSSPNMASASLKRKGKSSKRYQIGVVINCSSIISHIFIEIYLLSVINLRPTSLSPHNVGNIKFTNI